MSELDYIESWVLKNWCFWTLVLEKILESPLECKEIQPVHPKGNQSWLFIGRTDAEAETPILWPTDAKNWLIGKDPDVGKDWMWEEKGRTEDEMVGWHHWLNGHEFEQALGVGDEQESLMCCRPWGSQRVRHDWATELNWSNSQKNFFFKSPLPQLPLCHSILILPCLTFCCLHLFMAASVSTLRTFPGISPLPCSHKALIFIIPSVAEMGTGRIKVLHPFFTG